MLIPSGTFEAMLASAALPSGLGQFSARTASSQGLPFEETQKQLRQGASQASLQPSVPVWEQADLDSIPVPPHCNLPDVVVKVLKRNFLGKEVLRHENMQAGVQDVSQQKQLKAWKTELLQVCTARMLC